LPLVPIEQRVEQLESAVAALQDTAALEGRVADRVAQQLQATVSAEAARLAVAERRTASPAAASMQPSATDGGPRSIVQAVSGSAGLKFAGLAWFPVDIFLEIVAIFKMFVDYNYKEAWSSRLLTLILVPVILLSNWWVPFSQVPIVGGWVDKLVDVFLAIVLYKALSRQARRYTETRNSS